MENNLENKARFFALHWGQPIGMVFDEFWNKNLCYEVGTSCTIGEIDYIELKPLSSISDEDATIVCNILRYKSDDYFITGFGYDRIYHLKSQIEKSTLGGIGYVVSYSEYACHAIDYLRSKGYAFPWMGLSVDQLIEYGWIKLKQK